MVISSNSGNVQWLANGAIICSGCPSIEVNPTETTIYQFQRINSTYGCLESGSIKIDVLQPYVEIENPCNCESDFIFKETVTIYSFCLLYTSPSPRDATLSRMPSSA